MRHPDLRISSSVCCSRLPLGIPNLRILSAGIFYRGSRFSAGGFFLMAVAGSVLGRVNFALIGNLPLTVVELAEKTRLVAEMACGAVAALLDGDNDRIAVAVDSDLADDLEIAGLLALAPELVARAREIAGPAG